MPTFRVSVINQTFTACHDHDLPSLDDARKEGVKAALGIGGDEVVDGKSFFGAEIRVEDGDETLGRFLVSVGCSQLQ